MSSAVIRIRDLFILPGKNLGVKNYQTYMTIQKIIAISFIGVHFSGLPVLFACEDTLFNEQI